MKRSFVILLLAALTCLCGCHSDKKYEGMSEELAKLCKAIDKHPKKAELYTTVKNSFNVTFFILIEILR